MADEMAPAGRHESAKPFREALADLERDVNLLRWRAIDTPPPKVYAPREATKATPLYLAKRKQWPWYSLQIVVLAGLTYLLIKYRDGSGEWIIVALFLGFALMASAAVVQAIDGLLLLRSCWQRSTDRVVRLRRPVPPAVRQF